jgi:hypothetical protein
MLALASGSTRYDEFHPILPAEASPRQVAPGADPVRPVT